MKRSWSCARSALLLLCAALVSGARAEERNWSAPDGLPPAGLRTGVATTPTSDVNVLLNCLLGQGITVTNAVLSSASSSAGTFSGGGSIVGFPSGIILGTGSISTMSGPNTICYRGYNTSRPGDPDLTNLIGHQTYDATVLSFQFECGGSAVLSFSYVFASEEYNEFVGSAFNDVFAIFVNGNNAAHNIARVPASCATPGIPVSINNVNCGNAHCRASLPGNGTNCGCFRDNDLNGTIDTEMDGLTTVFTASVTVPAGWNTVKIAIADTDDHWFDSNVMIQCGSFTCTPVTGACCLEDGSCELRRPEACVPPGSYRGDYSACLPNPCPAAGACCFPSEPCRILTAHACVVHGGIYHGDGTACLPDSCPDWGACCTGDDACQFMMEDGCAAEGWTYLGDQTPCLPNPCPQTGACCLNSTCTTSYELACIQAGGVWMGPHVPCEAETCLGACCLDDGSCDIRAEDLCVPGGGVHWSGPGTSCCARPPRGMGAWWPFDGVPGPIPASAADLVLPLASAVLVSGADYGVAGKVGSCLVPMGYADAGNPPKLNVGASFAVDAWIQVFDFGPAEQTIVSKFDPNTGRGYRLFLDGQARLACTIGDGAGHTAALSTSILLAQTGWRQVVLNVAVDRMSLYLDGALLAWTPVPSGMGSLANGVNFTIGGTGSSPDPFVGLIDEVEFFRRSLLQSEITGLWRAKDQGKCREFASLTPVVQLLQQPATISVMICNFTAASHAYTWSLDTLTPGSGCTSAGPILFAPASGGPVVLLPGECTTVPVSVSCPTLAAGECARYGLTVESDGGDGCALRCQGVANVPMVNWYPLPTNLVAWLSYSGPGPGSGPTTLPFDFRNGDLVPVVVDYQVVARPAFEDSSGSGISLDGLPPGQAVFGSVQLGAGGTAPVSVSAQLPGPGEFVPYHVILRYDTDGDGSFEDAASILLSSMGGTGTSSAPGPAVSPAVSKAPVLSVQPMPFRSSARIRFDLARREEVTVQILDVAGRLVRRLVSAPLAAGPHEIIWDGRDDSGKAALTGMYFVRLRGPDLEETARALLTR